MNWTGLLLPHNKVRPSRNISGGLCRLAILAVALSASCFAQFDGGGGPSILSRGGGRPGQTGGKAITFNFYAGLSATYGAGTLPIDSGNGVVRELDIYGGAVNAGLTGSHAWRRSSVGMDYRGSYRKFSKGAYADGTEQAVDLQYTVLLSKRVSLQFAEIAGISNVAVGGFIAPTTVLNSDLIGVPTNNIFDNRIYYIQSTGGLTYRKSSRLSFLFSGDAYGVRRSSKNLIGMNGYRANTQISYLLSRKDQIGVNYNFTHFDFPRAFGASDLHGVNISYSRRLAPGFQLTLAGGTYRVESLGAQAVALSPEIAEILGQTTGIQAVYRVLYIPQITASLGYARGRSSFTGSVNVGATPGNGVYLTSKQQTVGLGYSYSGIRKTSLSLSASATQLSSVFQTLQNYRNYNAGGAIARNFARHLSVSLQADVRTFEINGRNRVGQSVSLGINWSPTEIPIPTW